MPKKFKKTLHFFIKNQYKIFIFLIILLAFILRFYDYSARFGLAYDQAHDAIVARYALSAGKIPLLGPFSSAGPFQTGGEWYWFIMLGTILYPYSIISPWVFLTLLYVIFVFFMIRFGTDLVDKKFGIILGLLTAISTAQVLQGTNLTNQSPISLLSLGALWSGIKYIRKKEAKYLFLSGFFASLAASIHLQGAGLFFIVLAALIIARNFKIKHIILLLLGIVLPLLPILISDLGHNFFNIKNMLYYFFHDQYRVSYDELGRRWSAYALSFWPEQWSFIIGGSIKPIGLFLMFATGLLVFIKFLKKEIAKEWILITVSFLFMFILLRYTRSPLFASYLVFLHPLVLILSELVLLEILRIRRIVGILFFVIILLITLLNDLKEFTTFSNFSAYYAGSSREILQKKYPGKKFSIYDYRYKSVDRSFPLVLYLDIAGLLDPNGIKLGVGPPNKLPSEYKTIIYQKDAYVIVNLDDPRIKKSLNRDWNIVNPSNIYHSTEEWY